MRKLIKITCILFSLILFYNSNTYAQDVKVGAELGYGTQIESIGIGAGAVLGLTDNIRGAADLKIFFPDSPSGVTNSFWELNANIHYLFLKKVNTKVYGLAGLNYATQKASSGGYSISNSEAGLNLGGGAEFGMGFGALFAEVKYALSNYDQFDLNAGLRFGF